LKGNEAMKTSTASKLLPGSDPHPISVTTRDLTLCPPVIDMRIAKSTAELDAFFKVRHKVFVKEQGIFKDSDKDRFDPDSIAIIAEVNGNIVGSVRCYRKSGKTWFGSRLAVLKEYRKYNLGANLVQKAVETMELRPDVDKFFATIQIQNVRFFRRLGWKTIGRRFLFKGVRHWMMQKPLNPDRFQQAL
jgi:putative N-acetyltransferase (TIGR04045 family)